MNFDFECNLSQINRVQKRPGCYAICEGERIMYIGRSVNLRARLKSRSYDKWCYSGTCSTDRKNYKKIDYKFAPKDATIGVWYCDDYKELEADLICNLEPPMNKSTPPLGSYGTFLTSKAKEILGSK